MLDLEHTRCGEDCMGLVGGLCGVVLHVRVDRRLVLGCFGVLGALWMDGGGLVAGMRCSPAHLMLVFSSLY